MDLLFTASALSALIIFPSPVDARSSFSARPMHRRRCGAVCWCTATSSADTDLDTDDIAEDEVLYLDPERRRGYNSDISAIPAPQRIELSPGVRAILEVDTPKSQLLRHFLHFTEAILAADPAGIDRVVSPDARFNELEAIGYPHGPEGLKIFRRQVNAAIPDEHISIIAVRFEGDDIIEADLDISATHAGEEFMGIPATGRKIRFDVHARGRFLDGKMAERWDRADFEDIKRQLAGPTP